MKINVFIQKRDWKVDHWGKAKPEICEITSTSRSAIYDPVFLLLRIFNRKPDAYIIRYLNDYPSLSRTILRAMTEVFSILLCKIVNIKVIWLCHNVDRETFCFYPRITCFRRNLLKRFSDKIFVTDPLLVTPASRLLSIPKTKIDWISFGRAENKDRIRGSVEELVKRKISEFKARSDAEGRHAYVCYCLGAPDAEKMLHFSLLSKLNDAFERLGKKVFFIVGGNFNNSIRTRSLFSSYKNLNGCFYEHYIEFSDVFVEENIDFYFRVYDDLSIPYSVYEAASFCKPVLTEDGYFLQEMLEANKIGFSTDYSFESVCSFIETIGSEKNNYYLFDEFLGNHNWDRMKASLIRFLG